MRTGLAAAAAAVLLLATGVALAQAPAAQQSKAPRSVPSKSEPAKTVQMPASGPPMTVQIVRSAEEGCEPVCGEWISAQGRIDASTPRQFRKVFSRLGNRKLPVLVDSAGGTVDEALAVGRLIRAKGLDVVVAKTESATCRSSAEVCRSAKTKGIQFGKAQSRAARCASSCAFLLAGGKRRFVGESAFAGVHQLTTYETRIKVLRTYRVETRTEWGVPVSTRKTLVSEKKIAEKTTQTPTTQGMYDKVRKYFTDMGIGEPMMQLLLATPSSSIHWLTRAELKETGLATDFADATQLFSPATVQAPAEPTAAPGPSQ